MWNQYGSLVSSPCQANQCLPVAAGMGACHPRSKSPCSEDVSWHMAGSSPCPGSSATFPLDQELAACYVSRGQGSRGRVAESAWDTVGTFGNGWRQSQPRSGCTPRGLIGLSSPPLSISSTHKVPLNSLSYSVCPHASLSPSPSHPLPHKPCLITGFRGLSLY